MGTIGLQVALCTVAVEEEREIILHLGFIYKDLVLIITELWVRLYKTINQTQMVSFFIRHQEIQQ